MIKKRRKKPTHEQILMAISQASLRVDYGRFREHISDQVSDEVLAPLLWDREQLRALVVRAMEAIEECGDDDMALLGAMRKQLAMSALILD